VFIRCYKCFVTRFEFSCQLPGMFQMRAFASLNIHQVYCRGHKPGMIGRRYDSQSCGCVCIILQTKSSAHTPWDGPSPTWHYQQWSTKTPT
jgi:hypothetical protein